MSFDKDVFLYARNAGALGGTTGFLPLSVLPTSGGFEINPLAVALTGATPGGSTLPLISDAFGDSPIVVDPLRLALDANALLYVLDPATGDITAVTGATATADGAAPSALLVPVAAFNELFNGATWDRMRSASAANLAALSALGAQLITTPGNWSVFQIPAVATQATISRAAGATGVRHVCTSIRAKLRTATAATAATVTVNLRDGATGAGTILYSATLDINTNVATIAGKESDVIELTGLNIPGSAATAMTLETAAAPAANCFAEVQMTGYDAS